MIDNLDRFLQKRYEPKTPRGLAKRIISKIQSKTDFDWREVFTPSYVFAMSVFLLIGLGIGIESPFLLESHFTTAEDISFLFSDEVFFI